MSITMTDEHAILDKHALADEAIARYLTIGADLGVLLDFDERTDLCVLADTTAVEVDEGLNLVNCTSARRPDLLTHPYPVET